MERVKTGSYMVWSILKGGERYSTLGLDRSHTTLGPFETESSIEFRFNQHYTKCNGCPDEGSKLFVETIESNCNKILTDLKKEML